MSMDDGSFRWPIGASQSVDSPVSELWTTISTPGNLERCHPFCESNPVSIWPGPESRDEVRYLNGRVYQRRFTHWIEGSGYELIVETSDRRLAQVQWTVEAESPTSSRLSIVIRPSALDGVPVPLRWAAHHVYIRPMLRRYLKSVLRGVDWYVTRGVPVAANQFGSHPWFST